jgi:hypothetical protein
VLLAAKRTKTPFVFSMGGAAGADAHLQQYMDAVEQIAKESKTKMRIAVISGEPDKQLLKRIVREGGKGRRSIDTPRLTEFLTEEDIDNSARIQAQMGPEPIMKAIQEQGDEIDGVITGRALDLGVLMAQPMLHGVPKALAAHAGKVTECGGMCCDPAQVWEGVICEMDIEKEHFTVKSAHPDFKCTVRSVTGHSLYEREDPFEERNPGGVLDIGHAVYEQLDERTVRASGGLWRDEPYTIKLEGAERIGFQAASISIIRDEVMIRNIDSILDFVRESVATAAHEMGTEVKCTIHVLGRDAALGKAEPMLGKLDPYEVGVLMNITAPTQEIALGLAATARVRLFLADFPGRRTTAGNTAVPLQQTQFALGEAYAFNVWHLLPLEDPCEPFPYEVLEIG